MTFDFAATVRDRGFDVALELDDGETVAVLGPNGAGKSTLLNVICGLLRPDAGHARLDGTTLFHLDGVRRRSWVPPHRRGVATLAQDALLFPHLTVLDNVAFGPRSKGVHRSMADATARSWLDRVHADGLGDRKPAQLSGGQAQRVAVARALATDPALLLLDEPMAALDVSAAPAIRRMLREVLRDQTTIIVTHDVLDAFMLADRVVVLEAGRIVDIGPTREVLDRPATSFAAALAALNLLTGVSAPGGVQIASGALVRARTPEPLAPGMRAAVSLRPAIVSVSVTAPEAAPGRENVIPGRVTDLEPRGDLIRVRSADLAADVTPSVIAALDLSPGAAVWFSFAESDAVAYPV